MHPRRSDRENLYPSALDAVVAVEIEGVVVDVEPG